MRMTNEQFAPENIVNVSLDVIEAEMAAIKVSHEASAEAGAAAEEAGDMDLAFAHASDLGVNKIKYGILEQEKFSRTIAGDDDGDLGALLAALLG